MTVNAARRRLLKITFYVTTVLTFMVDIDPAERLRWVKTPSDITKCADETLNLTWEYEKEENEEIRQFQWRINSSTLIGYRSVYNGLHIDPKYIGRVEESGVTGIMLKNITTKDKGSYSLYIIISWKDTPVIHSMWLNVIDAEAVTIPQWCTCERLPISQEWNGGKSINVVTDGCRLEVNSSYCCIREPANSCTDKNQQDLCRPFPGPITQIENVTSVRNTNQLIENDTRNGLVTEGSKYKDTEINTVNTVLLIALSAAIIMFFISIVLIVIFIYWYWRKRRLCTKEWQKANIKAAGIPEKDEEQRTHMLTGNNDLKLHTCLGNQGIGEKGETLSRLECVSIFSECDDDNDYASFGKTGNSFSGPDLTFDIKVRHNMLWTCDEMEIPAFDCSDTGTKTYHVPADKPRNNRDLFFSGNRRHVVGANDKGRNNQNYQNNISLNASYDSSDFKNTGDAPLTYVDLHFDDTPRSPKPIQIIENTLV